MRDRIHIIPETPEIFKYYTAADVFVCTSRVESYPRVVLEGMHFRLPIVTTPVFGISEQVMESENAFLFQPGDTKKLADHLKALVHDEELRERMGKNSQHVLATLNSFDDMVGEYGQIFQEAYLSK